MLTCPGRNCTTMSLLGIRFCSVFHPACHHLSVFSLRGTLNVIAVLDRVVSTPATPGASAGMSESMSSRVDSDAAASAVSQPWCGPGRGCSSVPLSLGWTEAQHHAV